MKNITFKYPNKLKELRKANNLIQKDISTSLAFTGEERISQWQQGKHCIVFFLIKLSKLFKIHAEEKYPEL